MGGMYRGTASQVRREKDRSDQRSFTQQVEKLQRHEDERQRESKLLAKFQRTRRHHLLRTLQQQQQHLQPDEQQQQQQQDSNELAVCAEQASSIVPQRRPLLTRRSKRCGHCDRLLVKPDITPMKMDFQLNHSALYDNLASHRIESNDADEPMWCTVPVFA